MPLTTIANPRETTTGRKFETRAKHPVTTSLQPARVAGSNETEDRWHVADPEGNELLIVSGA